YAACLKLWFFAALVAALVVPPLPFWAGTGLWLFAIMVVGILVGIVESVMARLRMRRVPHLLGMACALAAFALILAQVS
ncbi:MAG: hydrogenase, partial [Desulfovibrio sp.]